MQLMVRLRDLLARLGRRPPQAIPPAPEALTSEQYRQAFLLMDEEPGAEFVIGMTGKFMTPPRSSSATSTRAQSRAIQRPCRVTRGRGRGQSRHRGSARARPARVDGALPGDIL